MESSKTRYRKIFQNISNPSRFESEKKNSRKKGYSENVAREAWKMYKHWLRPFRKRTVFILMCSFLGIALGLLQPLVIRFLTDSIISVDTFREDEKVILSICIGLVALLLAISSFGFTLIGQLETLNIKLRIVSSMRRRLFGHLLELSLSRLERLKTGDINNRLGSDTDEVSNLFQYLIVTPTILGARVVVTFILLFWVNWKLALFATLLVPPAIALSFLAARKIRPLFREILVKQGQRSSRVVELFRGIRVLRTYSRKEREKLNFSMDTHLIDRLQLSAAKMQRVLNSGWTMILSLCVLVIICIGSILSIKGHASLGDIFALSLYTTFVLEPISGLVRARTDSRKGVAALSRLYEIFRISDKEESFNGGKKVPSTIREIELDSVYFSYEPDVPVLQDINFSVSVGETVALVGRSGSGKSTLVDLVSRFYSPEKGRILLNGVDVREFSLGSYRKRIAIVEQEVTLFEGSIAENIACGKPNATMREIEIAAKKADAHGFISSWPNAYDSMVGESGKSLSGGQKQRICIARAFLIDPEILILDEATSSLDSESEASVQASLAKLIKNRMTFVIAHRLSTIRSADKIVMLENGKVADIGTHDELMEKKGQYFLNVMRQADLLEPSMVMSST
ncbi:ABC transporter ATP-binding protein/permease [Puniceicoccaceae bacterium K14]|nr:ABC transporter ATP-binding protein/permease [Puniceicoccaceae bacterium K14]